MKPVYVSLDMNAIELHIELKGPIFFYFLFCLSNSSIEPLHSHRQLNATCIQFSSPLVYT